MADAIAVANTAQTGASKRRQSTRPTDISPDHRAAGTAIRACPYRSTYRLINGTVASAVAEAAPATAPARA